MSWSEAAPPHPDGVQGRAEEIAAAPTRARVGRSPPVNPPSADPASITRITPSRGVADLDIAHDRSVLRPAQEFAPSMRSVLAAEGAIAELEARVSGSPGPSRCNC